MTKNHDLEQWNWKQSQYKHTPHSSQFLCYLLKVLPAAELTEKTNDIGEAALGSYCFKTQIIKSIAHLKCTQDKVLKTKLQFQNRLLPRSPGVFEHYLWVVQDEVSLYSKDSLSHFTNMCCQSHIFFQFQILCIHGLQLKH